MTNRRLILKRGFIRRKTEEISFNRVEEVNLSQSIIQRILGSGDIKVTGTGTGEILLKDIDAPLDVQKRINETEEFEMTRTLLAAILLTVLGHAAVALEKINVQLLCEGEWTVELRKPQLDNNLGRLVESLLFAQIEKEQQTFSERISIKDNKLNDKVPVTVTDTLITTE